MGTRLAVGTGLLAAGSLLLFPTSKEATSEDVLQSSACRSRDKPTPPFRRGDASVSDPTRHAASTGRLPTLSDVPANGGRRRLRAELLLYGAQNGFDAIGLRFEYRGASRGSD